MDANQLFAAAEAAFAAKRYADARRFLEQVQRATVEHEAVLHLLALVEKRCGDPEAAERAFVRALELAPRDPRILGNYANFLDETGRAEAALTCYDRAIAADPRFADARLNRGLLHQRLSRTEEALRDYDAVLTIDPASVRAHSARGSILREQARFSEAAAAYDAALALSPAHAKALDGWARVALEAGERNIAAHFRRALKVQPDSLDLTIGMAEALAAEGDPDALPFLAAAVAARPDWIEGHERLAEMRSETRDPGHFARGFVDALVGDGANRALHLSHWRVLARAGLYDEALERMDNARPRISEDRDVRLMRAVFTGEAGDAAGARDLLADLGDDVEVRTVRARLCLRLGEPLEAARLLEHVVRERPGDIAAWAHLGLAWRATRDPRHVWLCEQPGLFDTIALDLDGSALDALATLLRSLHRTCAHPIGQSLRGGTQTRGRLFWRTEPEIVALRTRIEVAVAGFVGRLPAADATHPLLRHRHDRLALAGSWSVRLLSSGFHVSHIHPQGVLSSACYIALPPGVGGGGTDGWLDLGTPPAELGLALGPIATIEPKPGRLVLFPSYLYHGTRPFSAGERLTVAFDVT